MLWVCLMLLWLQVESRDDSRTAPELRLKFWHFFKKWQKWV